MWKELLGRLLKRFAMVNEIADGTRIYVACQAPRVIAYYSLTVGAVEYINTPKRPKSETLEDNPSNSHKPSSDADEPDPEPSQNAELKQILDSEKTLKHPCAPSLNSWFGYAIGLINNCGPITG